MVDFTTYRNPPVFFDIDEIARDEVDILLHTYGVSAPKTPGRGILAVAPHISLQVDGPLTYRAAVEHDCLDVTGLTSRPWQLDVTEHLHAGKDVVVQAMTGAGKSLPFILPVLADPSRFVIIASPLNILQSSMAATFEQYGLKCVVYNAESRNEQTNAILRHRDCHVLLTNPENLTKNGGLHAFLVDPVWTSTCALLGIDETHLVIDWGLTKFRPAYANLGQLRSFFSAPILAVSATLAPATVETLAELLHLTRDYVYLNLGNTRDNLFWEVREIGGSTAGLPSLRFLLPPTVSLQTRIPLTIIFVPSRPIAHRVANYLRSFLPIEMRLGTVVPLHAQMHARHKNRVLASFDAGFSRIMVCTTVAALGRDFRNVTRIVAFQLPENLEAWVQQAGRGARTLTLSCHALLLVSHGGYALKDGIELPVTESDSDDDDSDYEPPGTTQPAPYPANATADMFKKPLPPHYRSFIAPLSSFRPEDPCRCEINFRYFGNPGEVKNGLCDVCRSRGTHLAQHTPALIPDLMLPAGVAPSPDAEPEVKTRAPAKRQPADRVIAISALKAWRLSTYKAHFLDTGLPIEAVMPDVTLETVAATLKLYALEDIARLSPPWALLSRYGKAVLDVMHKIQLDEDAAKQGRKRAAAEKRAADEAAAETARRTREDQLQQARATHSTHAAIRRTMPKPDHPVYVGAAEGTRARAAAAASSAAASHPAPPSQPVPSGSRSSAPVAPTSPKEKVTRKRKSRAASKSPTKADVTADTPLSTPRPPKRSRQSKKVTTPTNALKETTNSPTKKSTAKQHDPKRPVSPVAIAPHPSELPVTSQIPPVTSSSSQTPSLLPPAEILTSSSSRAARAAARQARKGS